MEKPGFPVAVYGAGSFGITLFRYVESRYQVVCFCDGDRRKHKVKLFGLPVLSFQEAWRRYPDLHIFVATNGDHKYGIMDMLLSAGFPQEAILNYEPYVKYKSCRFLEERIGLSDNTMLFCCRGGNRHISPGVSYTGDPAENIRQFIKQRDQIISQVSETAMDGGEISGRCAGCPELKERFWAVNRHIVEGSFAIKTRCNFRCIYCNEGQDNKDSLRGDEHLEEASNTLRLMRESLMLKDDTVLQVTATEVSAHPFRNEVLDAVEGFICQYLTNASLYIDRIADSIRSGGRICSSLDAGTAETFRQVKGANMFRKVCENLKRYSEAGAVELKYIFLPGANDDEANVDGFLQVCGEVQPVAVHISRNMFDFGKTPLPERTAQMIARLICGANRRQLLVNFPPSVFTPEEYRRIQTLISEQEGTD